MIVFFWSGGLGGGGVRNLGAVLQLGGFLLFLLVPSLVQILFLGDEPAEERIDEHNDRTRQSSGINPNTESPQWIQSTESTTPFYVLLLLQVVVPVIAVGVLVAALTDDRIRRFLRLEEIGNQNWGGNGHPQTRRNRNSAAAIAAKIRNLPLIEYRSRRDLEQMPLKELVAYRNEARKKGYKAITTSSGKRQAEILQSREEVIQDIVGRAPDGQDAGADGEDTDEMCSICFAQYESNDILRILPKCGHVFHAECGDLWFVRNQSCPLCKADI